MMEYVRNVGIGRHVLLESIEKIGTVGCAGDPLKTMFGYAVLLNAIWEQ